MTTNWTGTVPSKCDACSAPIVDVFFDARSHDGRWGNFCRSCFKTLTPGKLGVGFGQQYAKDGAVWGKVA